MEGRLLLQYLLLCFTFHLINGFDPFAFAGSLLATGIYKAKCFVKECCTERWTNHNASGLIDAFNSQLFGQHLVNNVVSNAVANHLKNPNPKKALVLSFHGWTGSGKNYVSDLIANHVFREGTKSQYVRKKIAPMHYPHEGDLNKYKEELKEFIRKYVEICDRTMFIFEEMDKMPEGLTDVMKPFLDYHSNVGSRKSIFIFLSNIGGNKINKKTLDHFKAGKSRQSITNKQMEKILSVSSFQMEGGLKNSEIISSGLVDFFIPFLPMERTHIMQCAAAALKMQNKEVTQNILEQVADELEYFPPGSNIYSKTGCKQVEKKVHVGLYDMKECCRKRWTNHNASGLIDAFNSQLFGQHLVNSVVSNAVVNHLKNPKPEKALVLSFHGWTGVGKTYVSNIIAKHVFREGTKSQYVHKKIAPMHYPHEGDLNKYKEELKEFIRKSVKTCDRTMFIFEEMDEMPEGLIDVMKPFLDYHISVENLDFRKSVFVFLSNIGGDKINKETLDHFEAGKSRQSITSKQMNKILSVISFNIKGGFRNATLISSGLIDFFIPFLPLERKHILQCVAAEIKNQDKEVTDNILEQVADELEYFPPGSNIYSLYGCKRIGKIVSGYL